MDIQTNNSNVASPAVLRLPLNLVGRDFVVGDIHGCFDLLVDAMTAVRFDGTKDRLFCVGDLVDRGPHSNRALKLLQKKFCYATRGNHEDMFIDMYGYREPDEFDVVMQTGHNGQMWWRDLGLKTRRETINAFSQMPIAIEFMTTRGKVGIVHADIPEYTHWDTFTKALDEFNSNAIGWALWTRSRDENDDESGVPGIGRVFVGHTAIPSGPRRLGNIFNIDTGAVFGVLAGDSSSGHLTLVEATTPTYVLEKKMFGSFIDVRENAVADKSAFNDIPDAEKIDFYR